MIYKFLIYISYPYSIPIGTPLQLEIEKRGFQVFWFSELESTKKHFKSTHRLLHSIQEVVEFDPHIILAATDSVPDFLKGLKVQVFHGFPANKRSFKKDHFRIRSLFDLYTTHGPSTTKVFQELSKKYKTFDVIETGWSKIDPLFQYTEEEETSRKPIIMITSTFTKRLSLAYDSVFFEEIKRLANTGKYNFKCVLHPKIDQQIKDKFASLNSKYFHYYNTSELNDLFIESDIMLSDTTSAISEFVMQRKLVVTFNNNHPERHFINITQSSELESALDLALSKPSEILNAINDYISKSHPYEDGLSSQRVIDACIEFLHRDKSYLKKKPLNLIRKWKMRKSLKYFTLKSFNRPFTLK